MSLTLAATQSIAGSAGTGTAVTYTLLGDEITGTTDAYKVLAQGQLPTVAAAIYTATGVTALVKAILLSNVTSSAVTVTLFINGTAAANQIATFPIPANGEAFWSDDGWVVLDGNGALLQSILPGPHTVTDSMMAQMAAHTYKGNNAGATADVVDVTAAQLTADLAVATQSAQGALSAADKLKLDNAWYDANAVGILPGNTAAANVTAFNAWYAAAPLFATLYVPPGFYDFASELTLNRDIRLRILGAGKGRSIWRSTSATANLLNQTVAGYYISIEEMGFNVNGVTKTAGSAVRFAADNAITDVRRCEFQAQFQGIELVAATAMNVGVINECVFSNPSATAGTNTTGFQIGINGTNINMMIQNCTINITGVNSAGILIQSSGAVQVGNCDFIGGRNTLLVNATGVVSALYFSNCFFDQATLGSTVKFMGTFAISRAKFVQCGITNGSGGTVACEIAGTGTGTAIPEGIDFLLCDFYNNGFAGTITGILATGVRGFDVRFCRISGFTFGIDVTPYNANGITNFNISGCTIGPTENFAANGTAIRLNVGSFQYGTSLIVGNDLSGNTTAALVNNATFAAGAGLQLAENLGLSVAPVPITATPATIAATETVVHQMAIPANGLQVGTTYRIRAHGTISATAAGTFAARIRLGTAGTISDVQVCGTALSGAVVAAVGWSVDALVTVRTLTATGTALGNLAQVLGATPLLTTQTATVAVNATVANFLSLTLQAGGTTPIITVVNAFIDVIRQ